MDADQLIDCGLDAGPAKIWADPLTVAAEAFGIRAGLQTAHWIGQMMQESRRFTLFEENLNYSVETLVRMWPNRISRVTAMRIGRIDGSQKADQRAIANHAYGGRYGNGPIESGDGWKFRGRGPKQLTFRSNYERAGERLDLDLVGSPDLVLIPGVGALVAGWFWEANNIGPLADSDDCAAVTKIVNGGLNGLVQRQQFTEACKRVFA